MHVLRDLIHSKGDVKSELDTEAYLQDYNKASDPSKGVPDETYYA